MYWLRKTFGRFWPLFVAGAMLLVFMVIATKQDNLNVYSGGKSTYTVESESETEKAPVTNTYMSTEVGLSMQIPDGWEHVTKDGFDTFIHSASASSVQIQVVSYYPAVNNAALDSLSQTYSELGYTVTEFQFTADNSYYVIYQSQGKSGVTDYIETVIWDRQHVAKVVFTFNDANYEKLKDEIWYCVDSIKWDYEDPITDGYFLKYDVTGDFEYAVPDTWASSTSDSAFYAYDESSGSSFTVNLLEDPTLLTDITELDYSNFLSDGKQNFILNTYQQDDNHIYGEATYMNGETQMAIVQYYYANGTYQYILTYEFPADYGSEMASIAQNGLALTRVFYTAGSDEDQTESSGSSETSSETGASTTETTSGSVFVPDSLPSVSPVPETTEAAAAEGTTPSDENASTLTDALITITGISQDKAAIISQAWDSINAGTPTYAEGYKESDTSIIILVKNENNIEYYISIDKEGNLQSIHAGSEDGPLVYGQEE